MIRTRFSPLLSFTPTLHRFRTIPRPLHASPFHYPHYHHHSLTSIVQQTDQDSTQLEPSPGQIFTLHPVHPTVTSTWWTPLVTTLTTLSFFLLVILCRPGCADAARSGGRVGGSRFSSYRSSPSSSYSSSPSVWSSRRSPSAYRGSTTFNTFLFPGYGYGMAAGGMGSSIFNLIFYAFAAFTLFSVIRGFVQRDGDVDGYEYQDDDYVSERSCVCKVQVGLLGLARSLQQDLDALARRADTSSGDGLHYVLQETLLSLNRNPDYCIYGASEMKRARNIERAESGFNSMSMKERGKFKEETLSNWSGRQKERSTPLTPTGISNELIVVTILVATVGTVQIPTTRSREDLRTALNRLGSVRARDLLAVEVLWTPQDQNDTFTPDELMTDYPELCAL